MAANVIFKLLTQAQFDALTTKDNGTLYRVTTATGEDFYQGSNKLNGQAEIDAAIAALDVNEFALASASNGVVTIKGIKEVDGKVAVGTDTTKDVTLAKVATTGAAEDVSYSATIGSTAVTNVDDALDALAAQSSGGVASKTVYITETAGGTSDTYSKRYGIYQGATGSSSSPVVGEKLADIDIPKDMVVESGSVGTVTTADVPYTGAQVGDKYIDLVIANATSDHIYIPANSLVDVYTAQQSATQIQLAIDSNNVISASVVAGSIGTTELASKAVTTAKIDDGAVGTTQLASGVVTSLGKADTAVQSVTESDATTGTNGTITVDGTEVAVKGLGSAAYTASTAYDAAGSASTAETNAKSYADGLLTWQTV